MLFKIKARPVGTSEFQALFKRVNTQTVTHFAMDDDNLVILTGKDRVTLTAKQYYIEDAYEEMMKAIPQKVLEYTNILITPKK